MRLPRPFFCSQPQRPLRNCSLFKRMQISQTSVSPPFSLRLVPLLSQQYHCPIRREERESKGKFTNRNQSSAIRSFRHPRFGSKRNGSFSITLRCGAIEAEI